MTITINRTVPFNVFKRKVRKLHYDLNYIFRKGWQNDKQVVLYCLTQDYEKIMDNLREIEEEFFYYFTDDVEERYFVSTHDNINNNIKNSKNYFSLIGQKCESIINTKVFDYLHCLKYFKEKIKAKELITEEEFIKYYNILITYKEARET